jgi:hypothetical protein
LSGLASSFDKSSQLYSGKRIVAQQQSPREVAIVCRAPLSLQSVPVINLRNPDRDDYHPILCLGRGAAAFSL